MIDITESSKNQSETGHGRLQSDVIWIEFSGQACKKEELQRWFTL